MVELLQQRLDLLELLLRLLDRRLAISQTLLHVVHVLGACLVLHGAEVLDFLARVLDLGKAECGGGALEEVT